MSKWTHTICDVCWDVLVPGRRATRMIDVERETCCRCGEETVSGIYMRADPGTLLCKGNHDAARG